MLRQGDGWRKEQLQLSDQGVALGQVEVTAVCVPFEYFAKAYLKFSFE